MRFLRTFILLVCLSASGEVLPPRPATQAEVNAGTDGIHPVTSKTLNSWPGGGGATNNGVTPSGLKASLDSGTNNYTGTNMNLRGSVASSGLVVTNGSTNLSLTASTLLQADANKKESSVANGSGFLTNNNAGGFGWYPASLLSGGNFSTNTAGVATFQGSGGGVIVQTNTSAGGAIWSYPITLSPYGNGNTLVDGADTRSQSGSLFASNVVASGTVAGAVGNFGQLNITTAWITNVLSATNAFAGTVVDFNKTESRTNLSGNLTFTGFANITAGAVNTCIVTLAANGVDRTIGVPAGVHPGRGNTLVVTNGTESLFLFRLEPGIRTNVFQLDSP